MGGRDDISDLAAALAGGERSAVARALNLLEDARPPARARADALLAALPAPRLAEGGHLVGLTGPPGAGKSSLAAALIRRWRERGLTVGVLAVDPSSPLTGGALLGDRLRMLQPVPDPGVFIRSLAGRGAAGGLAATVGPMSLVLLAAFDEVLVETVGVGQSEVDIAWQVDTTVVVVPPHAGDTVQFLKAGLMEVPSVLVVSKADLGPAAEKAATELRLTLPRPRDERAWRVPVVKVSATTGDGVDALLDHLEQHRDWLASACALDELRRRQQAAWGIRRLRDEFGQHGLDALGGADALVAAWTGEGAASPLARLAALRARLLALWHPPDAG